MLNTSLRRVAARTCSSTSSPLPSRSTTPIAASFTSHAHQRRHSSSKPPVPPNNGSPTIPAAVKQVDTSSNSRQATTESRSSRRRSAKDKLDTKQDSEYSNWASSLPSVPSLQLNPKDVYLAAFFGTYRPTSITGPVVPESSMATVDKIFQPKPKRARTTQQDVIYALSSAIENLNDQLNSKKGEQKDNVMKAFVEAANNAMEPNEPHHLDGAPQSVNPSSPNVRIALQEMARRFRPYNVPPAPVPIADPESKSATNPGTENETFLEVEVTEAGAEPYVQRVGLHGQTNEDAENRDFFTSNTAPTMEIEDPAGFQYVIGEEVDPTPTGRRRQGLYRRPTMMAISVKRQRRLKMKKHKFKKLTRRLRTLRQRQGKI